MLDLSVFAGVDSRHVFAARSHFDVREPPPGTPIIEEGQPARHLFLVESGRFAIRTAGRSIGEVGPGDILGESVLFGDRAVASVSALGETRVWSVDAAGIAALEEEKSPILGVLERAVLAQQAARVVAIGQRIAELSAGTPREQLPPQPGFFQGVQAQFGRGGYFSVQAPDAAAALRESALFSTMNSEILREIANEHLFQALAPGHLLCTEGETGDAMFVIDEGEVEIVIAGPGDRIHRLGSAGPGTLLGMVALVASCPRMASCVARTRVVAHRLERSGWERLVYLETPTGTAFRRAVIRALVRQLASSNRHLAGALGPPSTESLDLANAAVELYNVMID